MRYSPAWFENFANNALLSAQVIVPLVIRYVSPRSVIDVGCGTGGWLAVFAQQGVRDVSGVDGPWVDASQLRIPKESFQAVDLARPFALDKTADLAMCLEVAEHLPLAAAGTIVKNLTAIAPVVLFSAAIPHQGGTGHVNEQWPEYWAALFKAEGYVSVDCIREQIWSDEQVSYWYAQNIFLFVRESELDRYPNLKKEVEAGKSGARALVHPKKYLSLFEPRASIPRRIVRKMWWIVRSIRRS